MQQKHIITGIDVGTTKIAVIIALLNLIIAMALVGYCNSRVGYLQKRIIDNERKRTKNKSGSCKRSCKK